MRDRITPRVPPHDGCGGRRRRVDEPRPRTPDASPASPRPPLPPPARRLPQRGSRNAPSTPALAGRVSATCASAATGARSPSARASARAGRQRLRDLRLRRAHARRRRVGLRRETPASPPTRSPASRDRRSQKARAKPRRARRPSSSRPPRSSRTAPGAARAHRPVRGPARRQGPAAPRQRTRRRSASAARASSTRRCFFLKDEKDVREHRLHDDKCRRSSARSVDDGHRGSNRLVRLPEPPVPPTSSRWAAAYEHVLDARLAGGESPALGAEAVEKLSARSVEVRPLHCCSTRATSAHDPREHRHPTRARPRVRLRGQRRGHPFVAPPEKMLGQFRYGPEFMNVQGNRARRARSPRAAGRRRRRAGRVPHRQ